MTSIFWHWYYIWIGVATAIIAAVAGIPITSWQYWVIFLLVFGIARGAEYKGQNQGDRR